MRSLVPKSSVLIGGIVVNLTGSAFGQTTNLHFVVDSAIFPSSALEFGPSFSAAPSGLLPSGAYGAAYGLDFGNGLRTEIQTLTSLGTAERFELPPAAGNIRSSSIMLNGLYELSDGAWHMKPYVGVRVGMVDVNQRMLGASGNDWVAAYQLRGGVTLGFNQKLLGSLGYEWTMGSKPHFSLAGIPTKLEIDRHGFVLGINYKY